MKKSLKGKVVNVPSSYLSQAGVEVTIFSLEVDIDEPDETIPSKIVDVTINEKVTIEKGKRIKGFYDSSAIEICFDSYNLLDEDGGETYENIIKKDY